MPFGLGIWEIIILAGVLVLLFGAKGAPAMARRLGTGVREMKDAVSDMDPRSVFDAKDESAAAKPKRELEAAKPAAVATAAAPTVAAPGVAAAPVPATPPETPAAPVEPEVPEAEPPRS
jgi:sec-independent protein translocase protein TatA